MMSTPRLPTALVVSTALHLLVLAVLILRPPALPVVRPVGVIPIGLVGGGGRQKPGSGRQEAPEPAASTSSAPVPQPVEPARVVTREPQRKPPSQAAPSAASLPVAAPGGASTGAGSDTAGSGGGEGGGVGTGHGAGSGPARVAYDVNPKPPYPLVARRLGLEGVVELSVLVATDGRPAEVHVVKSSGHDVLDESALTTVRTRWRFLPAERDGVPVEDRVTFPVRFALRGTEG